MEQNTVVDAIKAVLGGDRQSESNDGSSRFNITVNGNISITVHAPPGPASNNQAPAPQ